MRNINELLGLIKGINLDGVINEKETQFLSEWMDKNRNLAYDKDQAALITLIDNILEDGVVTDSERAQLISYADNLLNVVSDDFGKLYELNGIINGIVCDGIVNQTEVERLKLWMSSNSEILCSNSNGAEFCKAVDAILSDGVISDDEQTTLQDILKKEIKQLEFEIKLNYLKKQVSKGKNIGVDLIDLLDNDIAINEIHRRAESELIETLRLIYYSSYVNDPEIVVISLVLIGMLKYRSGDYYTWVRETYSKAYKYYSEQKIEGMIRSILGRYQKQTSDSNPSRYISYALENAIVPVEYLSKFFEFIYDIYAINFQYDLPVDLYDDFEFVYEGLKNCMMYDNNDLELNVTHKTYKLIVSTKLLLTKEDGLDALIKLSIIVVKLIDKRYWNQKLQIFNPYLKKGFEGWNDKLVAETIDSEERKKNNTDWRSRWKPVFVLKRNAIYLYPPFHKIKAKYDYRSISVVVTNGDEVLYQNNRADIREIFGGYQVCINEIPLKDPIGKLSYKVVAGDEIIYDSKDELYRDYIVFDNEGNEIKNNTDYEGSAFVCYKGTNENIQTIIKNEYFTLGSILVRQGSSFILGDSYFSFSSISKPGITGKLYEHFQVASLDDKHVYPVYKTIDGLAFETAGKNKKYHITINGISKKLEDYDYKTAQKGNNTLYFVSLNIPESGFYKIECHEIDSDGKNRIFSDSFVYDPEIIYDAERLDDKSYRITVCSGLNCEIDTEVTVDSYKEDLFKFEYDSKEYNYYIPFNLAFYRIGNNTWRSIHDELWIDDVKLDSKLILNDTTYDKAVLYSPVMDTLVESVPMSCKGVNKEIAIGFLNSYKNEHAFVKLVLKRKDGTKDVIKCYNKCVFDKDRLNIAYVDETGQVCITPYFHGRNKIYVELSNYLSDKRVRSGLLNSGETANMGSVKSFIDYSIEFIEEKKQLLQLSKTQLYKISKTFYSKAEFVGRTFRIRDLHYDDIRKYESIRKVYPVNYAYVLIQRILDNNSFVGEIYVLTRSNERYFLSKINPVKIEICGDVMDDTIDVYITSAEYGDGLLIDFDKHGIMNSLDDPKAPDIVRCTLELKGE